MSQHGHTDTDSAGASYGTLRSYNTGFILAVILTLIPFALVMYPTGLERSTTLLLIFGFAIVQTIVQLVYFLHMNRHSEGGWNLSSFVFTIVILLIVVGLSLWIIWSMNDHMMM
ncbi:cytochrome o ubiquinol oxidase subunit IV [Kerstersia gyiorum]|uniref:Cytochrome bo(3) ubiquinol oxidase subunit 4 n=1 Tax=Kerstersia gyiorum TaxID=206506 RepID=A0A171KWJ8_9BURK|nr:cytochrome o ubiquinol oxidase subunit IV [Kerstersia gyiorum]MCO7635823.1 cytochrome o ubiquinol oxidase subunit IV [Pseudomonas sp. S 311-6]KAB0544931.1 cytochrome o ubiquinol oxidase subunit IV [Kerstersia gyiorum]KKO73265.1 cytochrome C oxidase [Kerstersia gyiorum]MCP1632183.1 cytochrome o ubiquinol oxidase operon protein cyoD [Kerstersia gyiorum]MCP1635310.1 cytochrome o ubiquinol oxidase operon protein cyoD [Kerstersia gyiorum]